jgi:hypothetical protein
MYRFILVLILISNFSHSQKKMKIPPYLKKGDTVAIVCTARKFFPEDAKPAIELLEYWGLKVKLGRTIGLDSCQLGGTDAERIADFQEMMDDDNIKAIWCVRGGYGTVKLSINWILPNLIDLLLLSMIACLIFFISKENKRFTLYKYIIFFIGIATIILSELSLRYATNNIIGFFNTDTFSSKFNKFSKE